jgi:hypothetical protein
MPRRNRAQAGAELMRLGDDPQLFLRGPASPPLSAADDLNLGVQHRLKVELTVGFKVDSLGADLNPLAAAGMGWLFRLQPMARVGLTGRLDTTAPALRRLGPVEDARQPLSRTPSPQGLGQGGQCGHLQPKGALAAELGDRDASRFSNKRFKDHGLFSMETLVGA